MIAKHRQSRLPPAGIASGAVAVIQLVTCQQRIDAACYPGRTTEASEEVAPNCWNTVADHAENLGFPVVKTVCPGCQHRKKCQQFGYLGQLRTVKEAHVAICTHKRAEYTGLGDLVSGRQYVSIHENPIDLLRPKVTVEEADLLQAAFISRSII